MSISGRRPNDRARRIGKGLLEGLSAIGTALADGPKFQRIEEIDAQITELRQERDHLIKDLIEPGDYKVSSDYDPRWRKTDVEPAEASDIAMSFPDTEGRLTQCKGRSTSSTYSSVHPGCPYNAKIHVAHEFTLRD